VNHWETRVQLAAHPLAYPLVRGLARIGPVVRVPGIGVVVSDASIARRVLTDTGAFSKAAPGSAADLWTPVLGPALLLNMAGAEHARLRRKLAGLFTPSSAASLCGQVLGEPLAVLTARLADGCRVDLVTEVRRLAGAVVAQLVGLPEDPARHDEMYARGTEITSMVRLGRRSLSTRQVHRARRVLGELTAPAAVAFRRGDGATVPARMRELGLTESEACGAVAAFVLAGTETLVSYLPRLVAIAHDTGWLARLAADPGDTDPVIGEALRITVPSPVMLRGVVAPALVGRVAVRPGERVVIATLSCARAFGPFDPRRTHPPELRQLWFGAGPHFCLGAPLALAEIRAVLSAVLAAARRTGRLAVVQRRAARRVLIPGYTRLVLQATAG
jgi:cytochrome P450